MNSNASENFLSIGIAIGVAVIVGACVQALSVNLLTGLLALIAAVALIGAWIIERRHDRRPRDPFRDYADICESNRVARLRRQGIL